MPHHDIVPPGKLNSTPSPLWGIRPKLLNVLTSSSPPPPPPPLLEPRTPSSLPNSHLSSRPITPLAPEIFASSSRSTPSLPTTPIPLLEMSSAAAVESPVSQEDDLRAQLVLANDRLQILTRVLEPYPEDAEQNDLTNHLRFAKGELDEEVARCCKLQEDISQLKKSLENRKMLVKDELTKRLALEDELADAKGAWADYELGHNNGCLTSPVRFNTSTSWSLSPAEFNTQEEGTVASSKSKLEQALKSRDIMLRLVRFRERELEGRTETIMKVRRDIEETNIVQSSTRPLPDTVVDSDRLQSTSFLAASMIPQLTRAYLLVQHVGLEFS